LIIALFIILITTLGYVIGKASGYGLSYAGIALILAGVSSFGSYFYSDKLVLATAGAKRITEADNPELFHIVENLAIGDGTPMPAVYIVDDPSPNAFATGRDPKHAAVAVNTGLLQIMNKAQLEGVLAHELSHVKNYDTRLMAIVAILVGFVAIIADFFLRSLWFRNNDDEENRGQALFMIIGIVLAILMPIIATLIQLAISRKREFLADASGVLLTRYPEGLAEALEKIEHTSIPSNSATPATAHMYIANPFKGKAARTWFAQLFNTHPPIEERIKILREM
jgi:heat shock protein HtpX